MPLFQIVSQTVLALLLIRIVCATVTLSGRALALFLLVGGLGGSLAAPILFRLIPPINPPFAVLEALVLQFALLLPVYLTLRRRFAAVTIADAFLLAFLVGFGYDAVSLWLANSTAAQQKLGFTFVPSGAISMGTDVIAGYGYWSGLVALVVAVSARLLRSRPLVLGVGSAALLYAATESVAVEGQLPPAVQQTYSQLVVPGSLTPWLVLGLLIAAQVLEEAWVTKRAGKPATPQPSLLDEWHQLLSLLLAGKVSEYRRLRSVLGRTRQLRMASVESSFSPADAWLLKAGSFLAARIQRVRSATVTEKPGGVLGAAIRWVKHNPAIVAAWSSLFLIIMLLPHLPNAFANFVWSIFLFQMPGLQLPIVSTVLLAILLWRYINAPLRPVSAQLDPEEAAEYQSYKAILNAGMAIVLLTLVYVDTGDFYPFHRIAARAGGLPGFDARRLTTFLLLLATCASSHYGWMARSWKTAAPAVRRQLQIRNTFRAGSYVVIALVGLNFFSTLMNWVHAKYGAALYNNFQWRGNDAADIFGALPTVALCFVLSKLLFFISRRAEKALVPEAPRTEKAVPAGVSQ